MKMIFRPHRQVLSGGNGEEFPPAQPAIDPNLLGPIFITEGHGVVAYRVAKFVLAAGHKNVVIGIPNKNDNENDMHSMTELQQAGATIVHWDWNKPETFSKTLELVGAKSVFCALPDDHNFYQTKRWRVAFQAFVQAIRQSRVKNVVKLSFFNSLNCEADTMVNFVTAKPNPFLNIPLIMMHRECDQKLVKLSTINYCIVFASHLMSNPIVYQSDFIVKEGAFYGANGNNKRIPYVSPNDVAQVAVQALQFPKKHYRVGYTLLGPVVDMTDDDVAQLLGCKYRDIPLSQLVQMAKQQSIDKNRGTTTKTTTLLEVVHLEMAKRYYDYLAKQDKLGSAPATTKATRDKMETICGRKGETYEEYLKNVATMTPKERDLVFGLF